MDSNKTRRYNTMYVLRSWEEQETKFLLHGVFGPKTDLLNMQKFCPFVPLLGPLTKFRHVQSTKKTMPFSSLCELIATVLLEKAKRITVTRGYRGNTPRLACWKCLK